MHDRIQFETPENVSVAYQPAGLGTRFVAWFVDGILQGLVTFLLFILLAFVAAATEGALRDLFERLANVDEPENANRVGLYVVGLMMLLWGLGGFLYFTLFEFLMRGQTPGKKMLGVRVVSLNGFALEGGGILLRNVFRPVDQLPPLWIVPVLSPRAQRLGDMAAGTIVVSERAEELSDLRQYLADRKGAEARFHFAQNALSKLRPEDVQAVERMLERWHDVDDRKRNGLAGQLTGALARRLEVDQPGPAERHRFLEDLLAAEYRRQSRRLG